MTPTTAQRPRVLPSCRRIRITLRPDEWQILGAVAQKYRKPVSWVLGVAARAFLEPMPRLDPGGKDVKKLPVGTQLADSR
jgi:hypothetical protein